MEQNWESKISPYIYGQLISNKNDNTMRKEVFSTNGARTTGYSHVNEWSWMDLYLTPYTKVNSKWMKDLNIELKLYNSEENIGVNHHDLVLGNSFLHMTPETQVTQGNWTSYKFKIFCIRDFPGCAMVKTPRFHCREHGFDSWSGN